MIISVTDNTVNEEADESDYDFVHSMDLQVCGRGIIIAVTRWPLYN